MLTTPTVRSGADRGAGIRPSLTAERLHEPDDVLRIDGLGRGTQVLERPPAMLHDNLPLQVRPSVGADLATIDSNDEVLLVAPQLRDVEDVDRRTVVLDLLLGPPEPPDHGTHGGERRNSHRPAEGHELEEGVLTLLDET